MIRELVAAGCMLVVRSGDGGVRRKPFAGSVLPFCAQLSAHSNSSSPIFGFSFCSRAALQQSMSIMPPMLQWFSPKFSGTPANAPPKSTSKRTKDPSRFVISTGTLVKTTNKSQHFNSAYYSKTISRTTFGNRYALLNNVIFTGLPSALRKIPTFGRA